MATMPPLRRTALAPLGWPGLLEQAGQQHLLLETVFSNSTGTSLPTMSPLARLSFAFLVALVLVFVACYSARPRKT